MVWNYSSETFILPPHLTPEQRVKYCTKIIISLRKQIKPLNQEVSKLLNQQKDWRQKADYWKDKYKKQKIEINKTLKEMEKLRKEQDRLRKKIEKLTKTNSRYQVSLFDHGNFKHKDNQIKKPKGGQIGHTDTNRENQTGFDLSQFESKRIYAKSCGSCNNALSRVSSTRKKLLLDIKINPEVVKLVIESERQWCGVCHKEVNAKESNILPFTEYGVNTFMMVMILRFSSHCSMATVSKVLNIGFGLVLSKSDVSNILKTAASYLDKRYQELKTAVRLGEVIYTDETGWQISGKGAWMWIMASEETTVYLAAESRGKGIAEEMYGNSNAYSMTDGFGSYTNTIPKDKHLYCWAHVLRFAHEETVNISDPSKAVFLREELSRIYHIKFKHPEYSKDQLEEVLTMELDKLLNLVSNEEAFLNIQNRVKKQRDGLILSLLVTESGTNNLAERELRSLVLNRKVSFGSNTYTGMGTSAILASVIQTLGRGKEKPLIPQLEQVLLTGVKEKYSQYIHQPFTDSS